MWSKSVPWLMRNYIFVGLMASFINGQEQTHECERPCEVNADPKTCAYWFKVEKYLVRSKACYDCPFVLEDCYRPDCIIADGYRRLVTVINRQLPGPPIQVCLGDTVEITVENAMTTDDVAVHWHGVDQEGTPFMDGVSFLTQCPIHPLTTFTYRFIPKPGGSHLYHSHLGTQRGDGLFGAFIVRKPMQDEYYKDIYDFDSHIIVINDWSQQPSVDRYCGMQHGPLDNGPESLLINGFGRYQMQNENGETAYTPVAQFTVTAGKRYRFRVINAGLQYCPVEMMIDNHLMKLIATDGFDIEMVEAESLTTYAGERWDFVLDANQAVDNYWMKFKGLQNCDEKHKSVFNVAVLHYEGAEDAVPKSKVTYKSIVASKGMRVNTINVSTEDDRTLTISELRSVNKDPDPALGPEFEQEILYFDMYEIDNPIYNKAGLYGFLQVPQTYRTTTQQINRISLKMPPAPLLSQPEDVDARTFCDIHTAGDCVHNFCSCTHLRSWPLGRVVEIVLVDEGKPVISNHPMHLHGFKFRVVAMEKVGLFTTVDLVKEIVAKKQFNINLTDPVFKDTVTVPRGGFTIIRVLFNNPGYWLFHCHLEFHVEMGMSMIFKIGEQSDLPPVPENFPYCNDFM